MDYRTPFVIDFMKRRNPQEFYDHRTPGGLRVPLDSPFDTTFANYTCY
jgi:hypothetical protein